MTAAFFAGAAGGQASATGNSLTSFGLNARAAGQAWDRQKKWAERGPTYVMRGLEKAGINPILAVANGLNLGAPKPVQAAPASAPSSDFARNSMVSAQRDLMQSQTSAQTAQKAKFEADARLADTHTILEATDMQRRSLQEAYYKTPEGKATVAADARNRAYPNTVSGLAAKELGALSQQLKPGLKRTQQKNRDYLDSREWNYP